MRVDVERRTATRFPQYLLGDFYVRATQSQIRRKRLAETVPPHLLAHDGLLKSEMIPLTRANLQSS